ncbi:hypothetical protein RRG08_048466 [Elysia crispata]|uniref:Uncharacterized protein n=1 Tax=Elysia crispata TaxID=231223 RepID=A0AAE1BAB1_9GAST|nr:hypothetical protein RRG08_048466 [Elysia crispata]
MQTSQPCCAGEFFARQISVLTPQLKPVPIDEDKDEQRTDQKTHWTLIWFWFAWKSSSFFAVNRLVAPDTIRGDEGEGRLQHPAIP